jgi:hypothetical protein
MNRTMARIATTPLEKRLGHPAPMAGYRHPSDSTNGPPSVRRRQRMIFCAKS